MKLELTPAEFKQLIQLFTTQPTTNESTNPILKPVKIRDPEEIEKLETFAQDLTKVEEEIEDDLSIDELKERVYKYYYGTK